MNSDRIIDIILEIADSYRKGGTEVERMKNFDEQLIREFSDSYSRWQGRTCNLENPYAVWFFDGSNWKISSELMEMTEAYREFYRLTSSGKKEYDQTCETYYYLAKHGEELNGRHPVEEDEDDFSIPYLLTKSFGY